MNYTPTIGLEIHAELNTKSKMFCSSLNDPAEHHPNMNVCPVCLGHPGTLPVPNREAIRKVLKVGLALHAEIPEYSKFDRKNYFYPDLPKGYQISQYDMPLCVGGELRVGERDVRITRVHLEEDTGRLVHPAGADSSLVDFNRAGVPLMELVTEPDITSGKEAGEFARKLQLILRYLDVSDADMEKGQMRVEANVSVRPAGVKQLGTKVEVKNLNSFRAVELAIAYEIERQTALLEKGEEVAQETMGWDEKKGQTFSQRGKEEAHDYRYFPEPDIPLLHFSEEEITELRSELPELPQARFVRLQEEYGLSEKEAELFVRGKDIGEFFEKTVSELGTEVSADKFQQMVKLTANYIASDLMGLLEGASVVGEDFLITPENFAELVVMIADKKISSAAAKQVLKEMFGTGADPDHIIEEKGLLQVSDEGQLLAIAKKVLQENLKAVEDYKAGKETALQFLVGKLMAASKGSANPELARATLEQLLKT
ncbi:Asp-tRNA(Asn)/Glu-tRNA(Gln) amidotransferase subunit GatB [Patescibacteria group bacterium]|nr:Asp-tRNA(Asn)/Glu-tRNA(Gln) amidotransferase subunit GatB [Patescibacteria group bacterium]